MSTQEWYTARLKQHALLLRTGTVYEYGRAVLRWVAVDGKDGHTVGTFTTRDAAAAVLVQMGYTHTDNSAGESRAEVWTR